MAQPAKVERAIEQIIERLDDFDDDALWIFVCKLFPGASEEFLEDAFDLLTMARLESEPTVPLEEVLAEEDKRRGITR